MNFSIFAALRGDVNGKSLSFHGYSLPCLSRVYLTEKLPSTNIKNSISNIYLLRRPFSKDSLLTPLLFMVLELVLPVRTVFVTDERHLKVCDRFIDRGSRDNQYTG